MLPSGIAQVYVSAYIDARERERRAQRAVTVTVTVTGRLALQRRRERSFWLCCFGGWEDDAKDVCGDVYRVLWRNFRFFQCRSDVYSFFKHV